MVEGEIGPEDPRADDVGELLERHLAFGNEHSPPEDVHALDVGGLLDPAVSLFSLRRNGALLALGALKRLDRDHAELKSMHTVAAARNRGIGGTMLDHLIGLARARGFRRISLETGSMEAFAPARSLYASRGFLPCRPFADYIESPNSTSMTLLLEDRSPQTDGPINRP